MFAKLGVLHAKLEETTPEIAITFAFIATRIFAGPRIWQAASGRTVWRHFDPL